eukprot:gene5187-7219_t
MLISKLYSQLLLTNFLLLVVLSRGTKNDDPFIKNLAIISEMKVVVNEGPSPVPTIDPTFDPSIQIADSNSPTCDPTYDPTQFPTIIPTYDPTQFPTVIPTLTPSQNRIPTLLPTQHPTKVPTDEPSVPKTILPTVAISVSPSSNPRATQTNKPTGSTTNPPSTMTVISATPTNEPSTEPSTEIDASNAPIDPTVDPTEISSLHLTINPSMNPTVQAPQFQYDAPTNNPTFDPTFYPTVMLSTLANNPTIIPIDESNVLTSSSLPTYNPSNVLTFSSLPTYNPSNAIKSVANIPSARPSTANPTRAPSTRVPTIKSTTSQPSITTTYVPSTSTPTQSKIPTTKPSRGVRTNYPTLNEKIFGNGELYFIINITLSNLLSDSISSFDRIAIKEVTSNILNISNTYVSIMDSFDDPSTSTSKTMNKNRSLLRSSLSSAISFLTKRMAPLLTYTAHISLRNTVPIGSYNPLVLYESLTIKFGTSITNGEFILLLNNITSSNSSSILSISSESISVSVTGYSYQTIYSPTNRPTPSPTANGYGNSNGENSKKNSVSNSTILIIALTGGILFGCIGIWRVMSGSNCIHSNKNKSNLSSLSLDDLVAYQNSQIKRGLMSSKPLHKDPNTTIYMINGKTKEFKRNSLDTFVDPFDEFDE